MLTPLHPPPYRSHLELFCKGQLLMLRKVREVCFDGIRIVGAWKSHHPANHVAKVGQQ
jgi:hypothetical protein